MGCIVGKTGAGVGGTGAEVGETGAGVGLGLGGLVGSIVGKTGAGVEDDNPGGGQVDDCPSNRILTSFMSIPFSWLAPQASKVMLLETPKSILAVSMGASTS